MRVASPRIRQNAGGEPRILANAATKTGGKLTKRSSSWVVRYSAQTSSVRRRARAAAHPAATVFQGVSAMRHAAILVPLLLSALPARADEPFTLRQYLSVRGAV